MTELGQEWISTAIEALDRAYVSYSYFPVGACLIMESSRIYQGVNIENVSLGLTNCAERTAFFKAVSKGERTFAHLIVAERTPDPIFPYDAYRQVMTKFCSPDMPVTLVGGNGVTRVATVRTLLPYAFTEKGL